MARRRTSRKQQERLRIKKRNIGIGVMIVGLVAIIGAVLAVVTGGNREKIVEGTPDVVVEQEVYDYGDVAFNTPISTTFVVRNEGDGTLLIQDVPQVELRDGC